MLYAKIILNINRLVASKPWWSFPVSKPIYAESFCLPPHTTMFFFKKAKNIAISKTFAYFPLYLSTSSSFTLFIPFFSSFFFLILTRGDVSHQILGDRATPIPPPPLNVPLLMSNLKYVLSMGVLCCKSLFISKVSSSIPLYKSGGLSRGPSAIHLQTKYTKAWCL